MISEFDKAVEAEGLESMPLIPQRLSKETKPDTATAQMLLMNEPPQTRWLLHEEDTMKRKFKFDDYEANIIIKALIELRNQLIAEGRYTDAVDELILKVTKQYDIIIS